MATGRGIFYTNYFTGVHGNYLKPTIRAVGLDPDKLPPREPQGMAFDKEGGSARKKVWCDIRGAGHGIGGIDAVVPVATLVERLEREYRQANYSLGTTSYSINTSFESLITNFELDSNRSSF